MASIRSPKFRFALVASEFNREYTDALLASAQAALEGHDLNVVRVPGAFEIPLQVQRLARTKRYAAVIALGVVWQGKTLHAQEILRAVTDALMRISLETDVPVIHEVLAVSTEAEARARCMGTKLNRGREAAEAALAAGAADREREDADMGLRRDGREAAIQFLYQFDTHKPANVEEALAAFWKQNEEPKNVRDFANDLLRGALEKLPEVDAKIRTLADNWDFERLAVVDRNILRLAVYEMLFRPEIPPVVSINEAIEIAKKFSTAESGKFVNGLLDRVKKELLRPARQAAG